MGKLLENNFSFLLLLNKHKLFKIKDIPCSNSAQGKIIKGVFDNSRALFFYTYGFRQKTISRATLERYYE